MSFGLKKNLAQLLEGFAKVELENIVMVTDMTHDSREVVEGSLFVACKGVSGDGRDYVQQAVAAGASAVLYEVDSEVEFDAVSLSVPVIFVKHLQEKQGEIAARFYDYPSQKMTVIGITGTNGKTTCAQFITKALVACGRSAAMMGTLGYGIFPDIKESKHTTVDAITLQKRLYELQQKGAHYVVMEVSSHGLVQNRVNGVQFEIAVFTQLSRDHLDYHGTMETYAAAKMRLFQMADLQCAVVNIDDNLGLLIQRKYSDYMPVMGISLQSQYVGENNIVATKIVDHEDGFSVKANTPLGNIKFKTHLLGRFNITNLLTVAGVLVKLNFKLEDIVKVLSSLQAVDGRMQMLRHKNRARIVIDYSHTPDALQKALTVLREFCHGQLWCVFGCGGNRDQGKRSLMGEIAETFSDRVVITNDNPRNESPQKIVEDICSGLANRKAATVQLDRAAAIAYAMRHAAPEDIVLVAGKGHETYQIIGDIVSPFNDAKIVLDNFDIEKANDDDSTASC